jgi:phytoene desaturase
MRTVAGRVNHVVVVGAGFSGLSAALHLAGRGRQVTLLERGAVAGGRAGRIDHGGYRIDTGPSVITMREVIQDTFAAAGAELSDYLELVPLEPAYRAQFACGEGIDVHSNPERMAEAVRAFAGEREAAGYDRLRAWLCELYECEFEKFIAANVDSPLDMLTPQLARLAALGGFRRLDAVVARFLGDERLRRVFTFQSLYAGVAPQRALALYAVIAYMDTVAGVFFPRGGVRALPDALAAAAASAEVRIRYSTEATAVERTATRVTAVHTADGERIPCDAVVLSTELSGAYRLLGRTPKRPLPLRAAPSAVVLHAGCARGQADLAHHTISFGGNWQTTFDELTRQGRLMSDPSLLLSRPTASDPTLAPSGKDLISVLAPVPNLALGALDWEELGPSYVEELIGWCEKRLLPGFGASIEMTEVLTPADWAAQDMIAGTPFSLAHTVGQTGPFRPANLPRGVHNAVLAGSGTVPGVGVPIALISGRLAADRITGMPQRERVTTP